MKANKNTSFLKLLASLVAVAGVSALMTVPSFALTNSTKSTTETLHSQATPPRDDTAPGTQPDQQDQQGQQGQPSPGQ